MLQLEIEKDLVSNQPVIADNLLFLHHSEAFAYINMCVFPSLSLMAANCHELSFLQCLFFIFHLVFIFQALL